MPYCNQCGTEVQPADRYCAKCGGAQPANAGAGDLLSGVNSKTASLLCYIPVVGWVWAIVVLASARYRTEHDTRFHAFQGLYLFVAWLLVDWVVRPMFIFPVPHAFGLALIPKLLKLAVLGAWVLMIIKTAHGEMFRLPILGELADRSVSEQR
jgi:uncharacterized membrane protein